MPATITTASHGSNSYKPPGPPPTSPADMVGALGPGFGCKQVVQHCIPIEDIDYFTTHRNGFVRSFLDAYAGHHHVVIRPDDVWIAILAQFNFYVATHPEVARTHFLPRFQQGKKQEHNVYFLASSDDINIAVLASQMTRELQAQVSDPSFRDFILPGFSTTTLDDKVICAVMMLASMQTFFDVSITLMCGIPSITLLGTKDDWSAIQERIEPIVQGNFGQEAVEWGKMLNAVLTRFVRAFDGSSPHDGGDDRAFWQDCVRFKRGPAGAEGRMADDPNAGGVISGWLTVFTRWGPPATAPAPSPASGVAFPASSQVDSFQLPSDALGSPGQPHAGPAYTLDGLAFPVLLPNQIPSGTGVLPFKLNDNGKLADARLLAGHVGKTWFGMRADTLQCTPIWFLYVPMSDEEAAAPRRKRTVRKGVTTGNKSIDGHGSLGKDGEKNVSAAVAGFAYGMQQSAGGGTFGYGTPVGAAEGADKSASGGDSAAKKVWKKVSMHYRNMSGKLHLGSGDTPPPATPEKS